MGAARTRPRSWTAPAHWLRAARRPAANGGREGGGRAAAVNPSGAARGRGRHGREPREEEVEKEEVVEEEVYCRRGSGGQPGAV